MKTIENSESDSEERQILYVFSVRYSKLHVARPASAESIY